MKELSFYLIAICGGSASGKSSVIKYLRDRFNEGQLCIISMDDYYKPIELQQKDETGMYNFDLPESLDDLALLEDLQQLSEGHEVQRLEYTFNHPEKIPLTKTFKPAPVVIVEGLFVLHSEILKPFLDYSVFITASDEVRYARRKKRDMEERGISLEVFHHQWNHHVLPAYQKYIEPFKSKTKLLIDNTESFEEETKLLVQQIEKHLT